MGLHGDGKNGVNSPRGHNKEEFKQLSLHELAYVQLTLAVVHTTGSHNTENTRQIVQVTDSSRLLLCSISVLCGDRLLQWQVFSCWSLEFLKDISVAILWRGCFSLLLPASWWPERGPARAFGWAILCLGGAGRFRLHKRETSCR